jgi:hypothetical protein
MKKTILLVSLLMATALVRADDLSDGLKAWEKKDFQGALQIFTRLAEAGNPEAQFQLGEMIGYGEGRPEDLALSERWLAKAQAGGHKDAAASIATMRQRATRKNDIAHYTEHYDGADVSLASRKCVRPEVPAVSRTRAEIKQVGAALDAWTTCYNGFVAGLSAALPAGKTIPPDIAKVMSSTEFDTARQRMDSRYAAMATDAASQAAAVSAAADAWRTATERQVKEDAVTTARLREEQRVTGEQARAVTQAIQDARARGGK